VLRSWNWDPAILISSLQMTWLIMGPLCLHYHMITYPC
jgi:hypothetical protein